MDEETEINELPSVGERLREAREAKKMDLEDIASETRIPLRHLESLEASDWDRLPAPTYSIGFAKAYAGAIGLDRSEIAEQLRAEMGGYRTDTSTVEPFEPVDPSRTMPKWLVVFAIAAIAAIVLFFTFMRDRSLSEPEPGTVTAEDMQSQAPATPAPAQPQQPAANATGPVVLTAVEPAWIQVRDGGKTLYEGILNTGETYQVPPTATAPVLKAGKPEALRINVGNATAPPVGPAGQVASDVSLAPASLMNGGGQSEAAAQAGAAQNTAGQ